MPAPRSIASLLAGQIDSTSLLRAFWMCFGSTNNAFAASGFFENSDGCLYAKMSPEMPSFRAISMNSASFLFGNTMSIMMKR